MNDTTDGRKLTVSEASWMYHVPVATLRYWLDKGELTREMDDKGHLRISTVELERKLRERDKDK